MQIDKYPGKITTLYECEKNIRSVEDWRQKRNESNTTKIVERFTD